MTKQTQTANPRQSFVGAAPGTVAFRGTKKTDEVSVSLIFYDQTNLEEEHGVSLEYALGNLANDKVYWLNVNGLHDTDIIKRIGDTLDIHPLVLEDIVSPNQRAKVDYFDNYLYVVMRMLRPDGNGGIINEQLSLILTKNLVLTFQEQPGDVFEPVRERLRTGLGRLRKLHSDYLAYALIDALVDTYFGLLETYGDNVETLEEEILENPTPKILEKINRLKRELLFMRKAVWPLRELINSLQRDESPLVSDTVQTFLRDVYDHAIRVIDTLETLRDLASGLHDFYISSVSFKTNEVMKLLTIVGAIFLPLGFLVGVYGMNFDHMPELHFRFGYFFFWLLVIGVVTGLLSYFRSRDWL